MTETVKKTKAAAKPRKTTTRKKTAPTSADPVAIENHSATDNRSTLTHQASVSHEEVARLAHRFWKERGHKHGHHEEDWYRAEQELRGKAS